MPIVPTQPGVYIEEIPRGERTVVGVATSITAFVGRSRRGSLDQPIRCDSWGDFVHRCGGPGVESELGHSVQHYFVNGGSTALVSRVVAGDAVRATGSVGGPGGAVVLAARDPGSWGDCLRVTIDHGAPPGSVSHLTDPATFHLTVEEIDPEVMARTGDHAHAVLVRETFLAVSVTPGAEREVAPVLETSSRLVRATAVGTHRPEPVVAFPLTGGDDGDVTSRTVDYLPAIERLVHADLVNLVVVPPPSRTVDVPLGVWTAAASWCREHRAVLLVDPPSGWTSSAHAADLTGLEGLRGPNSAFYYPRLMAADPGQDDLTRPFAPGGAVAGVIARTDRERGVWTAPAGTAAALAGAVGLEHVLTGSDVGVVTTHGVNPLIRVEPGGPVVWGARTGQGTGTMASEWKYLPVRRLALFIEESLSRGLGWAVFEPNDERLWAEVCMSVEAFMQGLYRAGAFVGRSSREAYQVTCGATTTSAADVAAGVVNVLVAFAPLKPAEFVVLRLRQQAGHAGA